MPIACGMALAIEPCQKDPVSERLPASPRIVDLRANGKTPGRHGGTLRLLNPRRAGAFAQA